MRHAPILVLVMLGCRGENDLIAFAPVELTIESPTYGAFLGAGPIAVVGRVSPPDAVVRVEGELVETDADGRFVASVPFDRRWRVVDVEAGFANDRQRVRVPVFDGLNPLDSWPGGLTLRVTPAGLAHIGEGLGAMVDATGWATMVALPPVDTEYFDLVPVGITHDPSVVELTPAEGGIGTAISLRKVAVNYDMTVTVFGMSWTEPVSLGFGDIAIGALAVPNVDDDGMLTLKLTDAEIRLNDPEIVVGALDGWLLELLVDVIADWIVEPLGGLLLDLVLSTFGTIPLGGPYAFGTDLMGMPIDVRLSEVWGDLDGLGAGLGMGLGEPAKVGPLGILAPEGAPELIPAPVHAAIGLHEGLLQTFLGSGLVDMLSQDITLPGMIGEMVGGAIRGLPGGDEIPANEGYCLAVHPQPAMAARLQEGTAPLAVVYLPDLDVRISTYQGGACWPWLEASVAAEVGLRVKDGTKVGVDLDFVEGAVISYGAKGEWQEQEVIDGLLGFLDGALGLLGGALEFDLADLAGFGGDTTSEDPLLGALGDVQPAIVGSEPMLTPEGTPAEGLFAVYLQLWEP